MTILSMIKLRQNPETYLKTYLHWSYQIRFFKVLRKGVFFVLAFNTLKKCFFFKIIVVLISFL